MTEETLLLRQINPSWYQQGRVTSQAFKPTPKDESLLSVYDGSLISPEKAWEHFTRTLGFQSVGVLAISLGECKHYELPVRSDPHPFPEHAVIDFTGFLRNQIENKAKLLRAVAVARGWQYRAEDAL
jgi:hypothetical protein